MEKYSVDARKVISILSSRIAALTEENAILIAQIEQLKNPNKPEEK